jgi:[ribosomal protein S5]-alanine N-acetyltransferase
MLDFFRQPERIPSSIASKRLKLSQTRPADAEAFAELFSTSFHDHLEPWSPPTAPEAYGERSRRHARDYIEVALDKWETGSDYRFFIRATDADNAIVGQVGLTNLVRGAFQSCFIGYWIGKQYINKGYATEAVVLALEFGFEHLHLHRASLWIGTSNVMSLRVVEKLGLRFEGTAERALYLGDKWQDTHVFAITVEEWEARKADLIARFAPR